MALGKYEIGTTRAIGRLLKPGMVFLDVGAHIGWYTLHAARTVGTTGRVYSFEPYPPNAEVLERNVEANGLEEVVRVARLVVSNESGRVRLFVGRRTESNSIFHTAFTNNSHVAVAADRLDAFVEREGWPRIDLIKLDVEGAEFKVLEGMAEVCRRNSELRLIIEVVPLYLRNAGVSAEELSRILSEMCFHRAHALMDSGEPIPLVLPLDVGFLQHLAAAHWGWPNLLLER
jgi:FkbM family methyltransferase